MQVTETAETKVKSLLQQYEKLKAEVSGRQAASEKNTRRMHSKRVHELESQLEEVIYLFIYPRIATLFPPPKKKKKRHIYIYDVFIVIDL